MRNHFDNTAQVVRRELRRIAHQPMYWMLMVVLPLISFAFFAVIFERGVARNIPIAVLDQDHTALSRKLTQMIDDTPTALISYEVQSMEEAERLMREGRISAVVEIPAFFEKNILRNTQTHIESSISGANITVNGLLSKDLQTVATTFQAGIQLQLLMKQGLTEKQAMAQIMPVRFVKHVLFNPYINYSYYLSPSFMPMMLMIFAMLVTIFAIGTELKHGTAREWLDTAGGSVLPALVGKMLPLVAMMLLMTLLMFVILFDIVGVPLNGSLAMLLTGCMLFVLAYMSIGVLIISVMSNLRMSLSLGGGYSVLAFTFSGLTFPMMAMYPWVRAFSKIFPFTYYTDLFIDQALRGAPIIDSVWDMGCIALFIVLPMLCLPRLREICTNEKYWGRL
ncbi:ABC transporter permease [Alistipes sp.]|uniref:ABC transporter permease n=1 Tax=Alistipes sp. TaxID=1872444 RepID=UPI003A864CCB